MLTTQKKPDGVHPHPKFQIYNFQLSRNLRNIPKVTTPVCSGSKSKASSCNSLTVEHCNCHCGSAVRELPVEHELLQGRSRRDRTGIARPLWRRHTVAPPSVLRTLAYVCVRDTYTHIHTQATVHAPDALRGSTPGDPIARQASTFTAVRL